MALGAFTLRGLRAGGDRLVTVSIRGYGAAGGDLMHELSIAESVIDAVLSRTGDQRVSVVRLRVGRLAGVVRDSLEFCFELASAGTPLEGATLEIDEPEGRLHCRSCGDVSTRDDLILLCECGSADVDVVSGRELELGSVEVA